MANSKQLLTTLRAFQLDNPDATWGELKEHLRATAEDILATPSSWDEMDALGLAFSDHREALGIISRTHSLTVPQARAVDYGQQLMVAAEGRSKGGPAGLVAFIDKLNHESNPNRGMLDNASLSVGAPSSLPQAPYLPPQKPLSWDELTRLYMEDHGSNLKESTRTANGHVYKVISQAMEAIGLRDLRSHTRAHMVALKGKLLEGRQPSTVNNLLAKLQAVLDWAERNDQITKHYAHKLKITKGADSDREAFSREQVLAIMNHAATLPATSWQRWAISVLAVTGARVGEISYVTQSDIKEKDGIWCLDINEDDPGKSLKNKHSARLVPLVDGALGFDLQGFLEAARSGALPSDNGISPRRASQGLGQLIRQVLGDEKTEDLTLHSLRHHLSSSMQQAGIPVAFAQAVLGHAQGSIAYDTYGSALDLKAGHDAIAQALK